MDDSVIKEDSKKEEDPPKKVAHNGNNDVVPQLDENNITFDDLNTAIRVLQAVASLNPCRRSKRKKKNGNIQNSTTEEAKTTTDDGIERYKHSNLRPFRKALADCLELQKRSMFQGKDEETYYEQRKEERSLKRQKMSEKDHQKKFVASTALRKGRIDRLRAKQNEAQEEEQQKLQLLMIPDGHVDTSSSTNNNNNNTKLLLEQQQPDDKLQQQDDDNNDAKKDDDDNDNDKTEQQQAEPKKIQLPKLRSCYVCKTRFRELHHFYDQLCPPCATLNWKKRHQSADLKGRVAIVTGSRVKIGYQTCLKLLRAGATVVATTRFPNAALANYRKESDFATWQSQLHVYGLDLRDVTGLEAFTRFLKLQFAECGIDILINNACQTVRRPRAYYTPMVQQEESLWEQADEIHKSMLVGCSEFERVRRQLLLDQQQPNNNKKESSSLLLENGEATTNHAVATDNALANIVNCNPEQQPSEKQEEESNKTTAASSSTAVVTITDKTSQTTTKTPFDSRGVSHSTAMSQMIILPEDVGVSNDILPPGLTDINGQQLDLRKTNSWLLKMDQVTTPEVMECMLINAIAPFVLNSRLQPLMMSSSAAVRPARYIVNVSAMEGKFYRYKMPNHPHTNMAKAALNMMTRTSAEDLAKHHGIYMNSIDTGWINDENPLERANKTAQTNLFQTPIDEIDAAARILDPIFVGVNHSSGDTNYKHEYGKFLKDYRESEW